ncbi:MAG: chromosome segregation protein SMC [Bacteroidia bacterium]|nr:chromosome segregation protein SMC [Bacteroidia bacterium]MDW8158143.1 chromosome segregation protein SMC [Bacteroidia bacterium]
MKLTALEIYGFKSFAERTKFTFDSGITGIVGPNGCGKSNIIDSIRWVLGEQKTKNLRSEKMENVIFNGTDKRKKANFAEVSITFENTKNILPTEYTTVTITRRLYRDGESEYLINNVACRLKDINNLFLDTGIGPDSYAIIELSMIDSILNDKNNSRRNLFEEAAGISRYKIRKKETLQRLEETDGTMQRIGDLLFEIEKNMRSLEKQAKRAEQFLELKEQYRTLSLQVTFLKVEQFQKELQKMEKQQLEIREQFAAINTRTAKHEARIAELQKDQLSLENELSTNQKSLNQLILEIKKLENEKDLRIQKIEYLKQHQQQLEEELNNSTKEITTIQTTLEKLEQEIDIANEQYDKQEFLLAELEEELQELQQAVRNRQLIVEENSTLLKSREQELQRISKEIEHKQIQQNSLSKEQERILQEYQNCQQEQQMLASQIQTAKEEIDRIENETALLIQKQQTLEMLIQQLTQQMSTTQANFFETKLTLEAKQGEYNLTKDLIQNMEGYPASLKYLKQHPQWIQNVPLVSDIFDCPAQYKIAIENFLEPYLNHFVVETKEEAQLGIQLLETAGKGRANFIILQELNELVKKRLPLPVVDDPNFIYTLNLVSYPEKYFYLARFLFEGVYIISSNLKDWDKEKEYKEYVVALLQPDGSIIDRHFAIQGGSIGTFEGKRIGRAQNLEKLKQEIGSLKELYQNQETELQNLRKKIQSYQKELPTQQLAQLQQQLHNKKVALSGISSREQEYRNTLTRLQNREQSIKQEIAHKQKEIEKIQPRVHELVDTIHELEAKLQTEKKGLQSKLELLNNLQQKINRENIQFINIKNQIASLKKDFRNNLEKIKEYESRKNKITQEIENTIQQIQELEIHKDDHSEQIVTLYEKKKQKEEYINLLEQKLANIKNLINQNENFIRNERKQKEELSQQYNTIKDAITEIRIQQNGLLERLGVEWQVQITELQEATLFPQGKEKIKLSELEITLQKLREKYNKFGEVNPTAIEAYKEIKERYDFMMAQREDLIKARQDLLATMTEIDTTAKEQFLQAFHQIRENFIKVFRTLFTEHDTCDLVLVDPNDPLESPIDIIAKPKGKRPLTINQLSGGEKTLTATSLLFAIYLLKPAPFCIFDEVDAPLDDANIDKFNNIIREFSKDSQFIIVTHNKRTMVKTNVIYGVTMQEPGVSTVLPVDLTVLELN